MFKGTSASAGIGIGKAVIVEEAELVITRNEVADAEAEIQRFKGALEKTIAATQKMADDLASRVGEKEAEIMQGHMMLLSDPMLTGEIENSVKNDKVNCEFAIENVCNMYADMFASMGDELMQQRATDMRDIKVRMQRTLMGLESVDVSLLPKGSILVAKDLTPSMTAGINPENVSGIVTELGGKTSHSAILARALEIPAVVAVNGLMDAVKDGDSVVLDGSTGEVFVNPEASVEKEYEEKRSQFLKDKKELEKYIGQLSVTKDGVQVEIVANIGKPEDVDKVLQYDGEGVGLFRTEFLFMDRTAMPTEEEQFEAYKKVAIALNGKPVIIRTLDIGGDKEIPYMGLEKDENPFLGYRAIRLCLDRKEDIYKPQLRALLRASAYGNIRIMIPLVTCIDELREAKALIEEIKAELDEKNIAYKKDIQVGIMVETAAASLIADIFAKEADFFSIGTNDLTQYTMSVDRGNKKVSYLYSTFNPAVLRSIRHIGYKFLVFTGDDHESTERKYIQELLAYKIEGMIILSHTIPSIELASYNIPIVTIEREDQYVSSVNTDNYMGGVQATSLLSKTGADILIHINADIPKQTPSYERIRGFSDICKEYNIPHEMILTDTGHTYDETSRILKDLLETIDTKYKRKTKGIFLPNDTFANIMLNHLIQKYGCLPDDYKIIGFDDSPVSREAIIPISTVGQQIDKIALSAMELLNEQIEERHKRKPTLSVEPTHKIIPPILINRKTTLPVER